MKKPRAIAASVAAVLLVAFAAWLLRTATATQPTVTGRLRPDDPPQIQQAVLRYRWKLVRESLTDHDFRFFFSSPFLYVMRGQVREIGSTSDERIAVMGPAITNLSSAAYVISGYGHSQHSLRYHLKLTTNGWTVVDIVYR